MPHRRTPEDEDEIRTRWDARRYRRLPIATMPEVAASVVRVLEDAQGWGLRQGTGSPEVDERYRRIWPTCRGAPETRLPGLVEDDLKAHGRRVPWERVVRGSHKLLKQGGGHDLRRILLELKAAGRVECISGERATYEDCDGKQVTGEVAWRLRPFGPHPMFSSADTEVAPFEWLGIVAATVDRWVQEPAIRRRFMAEYDESTRADGRADWLRGAAITLPGSFALLMAVHDKYADAERLLPDTGTADFDTAKRSMAHFACMSHVARSLRTRPEATRDLLRDAFRQVVAALKLPVAQCQNAAAALGLPVGDSTATSNGPVSSTVRRALALVPFAPHAIRGDLLASKLDVTSGHLRKEIIPKLKQLGVVTTGDGYQRRKPTM